MDDKAQRVQDASDRHGVDVDDLFDELKAEIRSDRLWVLRTTVAIALVLILTTVLMVVR